MAETEQPYLPATGRLPLTALYDPVIAVTVRERTFRRAVIAAALADDRPDAILDVGCGTGTLAIGLAKAAPGAAVTAVDGDRAILARARRKATGAGVDVRLIDARAEELPFPDASFDCVVSTLMLHHLAPGPKREALRETARVLRAGGRLVIADWGRPRDPVTAAGFLAIRLLDGFEPTREHAAGRLPELVSDAGFTHVETRQRWRTVWGTLELLVAHAP